jgi:hypothetical protein
MRYLAGGLALTLLRSCLDPKILGKIHVAFLLLFDKICPIMEYLDSKDSSRHLQINCTITYFLPTYNAPCMATVALFEKLF